jgi:GxxExxY protein
MHLNWSMSSLEERIDAITYQIRSAAITVHRRIGPGCLERAYAACFAYELQKRGLEFQREVPITLLYDDLAIPRAYEPDFIVGGLVVAELKVGSIITATDTAQLRTYLRLTGCPVGLLLNFGAALMKDGIVRQVNNFPHGTERGRIPPLDPSESV